MRLSTLLRGMLVALAVTSTVALSGCSKKTKGGTEVTAEANTLEANISSDEALTEQTDAGNVTWVVTPEGQVKARFKTSNGSLIDKGVTGTLTVKGMKKTDKPVTVKLERDPKSGLYVATIPKLGADLTEMSYDLDVNGKPVKGALHLPHGGTRALVTSAKASAENKLPEGKKGPNGGVVQVVGSDVLEIAADQKSGEVRVYVLSDDLKPMPVGKRRVKLGVVAAAPEMIELEAEPKHLYFTGKLTGRANPVKLTVELYEEDEPEPVVVLCGWTPGTVIVVGAGAPVLVLFAIVTWPAVVIIDPVPVFVVKGKGKHKHKIKFH